MLLLKLKPLTAQAGALRVLQLTYLEHKGDEQCECDAFKPQVSCGGQHCVLDIFLEDHKQRHDDEHPAG